MSTPSYKKFVVCGRRRLSGSNVFLAALPLDPARCRLWVQAIGQEDLVQLPIEKLHQLKFVCDIHFAREDYNTQGNRLLKHAVPRLHLGFPPLPEELFVEFPLHIGQQVEHRNAVMRDITNIDIGAHRLEPAVASTSAEAVAVKEREDAVAIEPAVGVPVEASTSAENIDPQTEHISSYSREIHCDHTYCKRELLKEAVAVKEREDAVAIEPAVGVPVEASTSAGSVPVVVKSHTRKRKRTDMEKKPIDTQSNLVKRLKNAKNALQVLAKTNLDRIKSNVLKSILEGVLKNQNKKARGKRWDLKNKISALAIFKRSPRTYRFLEKIMPLPSEKTLHRVLKNIPMEPGINNEIIEMLKKRTEKTNSKGKNYALLFDEIALKKRLIYNESTDKVEGYVDLGDGEGLGRNANIADHALVFMIQGIGKKSKQPVAYYFVNGTISSEKLSVLIKKIIKTLREIGINVITTVCDQGPTNIGALNLLKKFCGLTPEENFFFHEEEKIFIMYDIPHLFKSIRNNFYQAGEMMYDQKIGKWCHLIEAEKRNREFLNFPKIKLAVVNPTYRLKMKVKYAAHALSNTMSAVLKMMAMVERERGSPAEKEISDTADIIKEMDKLFDVTNGPSCQKDIKKGIRENVSQKTTHVEKWNYYLKKLDSMKFLKSDSRLQLKHVRCIKGLKISLQSLKDIWSKLKNEGYRYLNLRQLNQDSLENLFGTIRQHSVTNRNPTCSHFTAALKTSIISQLTASHNRGSNCEDDENKLLLDFKELLTGKNQCSQQLFTEVPRSSTSSASYSIELAEYPVLSLPEVFYDYQEDLCSFEQQPVVYVSGYIAAKLLNGSSCSVCQTCLKNNNPESDDRLYKYISLREWWQDKQSLTYPTRQLCETVNVAKITFQNNVEKLYQNNICKLVTLEFVVQCDMSWFACSEHKEIMTETLFATLAKLFIRKQCKIINDNFSFSENDNADASKKAQQQCKQK